MENLEATSILKMKKNKTQTKYGNYIIYLFE